MSGRVDETYVKVKGKWLYLYRAIDKYGDTIDFYLSSTRNTNAAKRSWSKPYNLYQSILAPIPSIQIRILLTAKQYQGSKQKVNAQKT